MKKSTFWSDFKKFIAKGNVIDLAVAVVIGGAFGKITTSLVNDIIMPVIGLVIGGLNVAELKYVITEEVVDEGVIVTAENAIRYGNFLQMIIDFLIISFSIFIVLRVFMNAKKKFEKPEEPEEPKEPEAPAAPVETTDDILKDIRELLKEKADK